ncbi:helix-turn-helix domain-containing protein [Sphingobacterium tabacisoli]|uniref:Helix-turn-helix domain-containing protein n=1 Tax=Sphingobacterium tabacisoli TaxID=2044855 RepID=A0ABW5L1W5_9SPHI|nr:helix-turn-helix transcriptional regulator [Sphingobacterium tabacisoli]
MDIKEKFGLRVKEIRQQKGISQEGLALIAEVDRTYIQSIEGGKRNVSLVIIEKLAKAFDLSIESLLKNL